jgi:hypothetical protein
MILKDTYMRQLEKLNPIKYKYNEMKKILKDKIIHICNSELSYFKFKYDSNDRPSDYKEDTLLNYEYLNTFDFEIMNMAFENKIHIEEAKIIHKKTNEKYKEYLKICTDKDGIIDIYNIIEKTKLYRQNEINNTYKNDEY